MELPLDDVGEEQVLAALLAVIRGEESEAVRILDKEMTAGARIALRRHLARLSLLADDARRCPRCLGWAPDTDAVTTGLGRPRWHQACHDVDLHERTARGDRRPRLLAELKRRRIRSSNGEEQG